jgi:glucose-1-phosphate thymidylyltransferase
MKTIILAGGYGARLQEDIQKLEVSDKKKFDAYKKFLGVPKPLLEIDNKALITRIVEKVEEVGLKEVIVRVNNANDQKFIAWKNRYKGNCRVDIISDGLPENIHGQGVFGGVLFILEKKKIEEDVLILAGDTIFDYDLKEVLNEYKQKRKTTLVVHKERQEFIRQRGVVEFDKDRRIISYEEKPADPKSIYAATPTFIFDKKCTALINKYMGETKNDNNMGNIIPWFLAKGKEMYVFLTDREMFDVGNIQSIQLAEDFLRQKKR